MGIPYGSMSRRKERTEVIAAYIKGGAIPRAKEVAEMLGVSESTAQRTIVRALDFLANGCKHEIPSDSSKKMEARTRILCNDISFGGGFASLTLRYVTMWGPDFGAVELTIPVTGAFRGGRLPFDVADTIAARVVNMCREKWGKFICDLTPSRVIDDLNREEVCWGTPTDYARAMEQEEQDKLKNIQINGYES